MSDAAPIPDTPAAIDFLRRYEPDGPWLLTAIRPDRKLIDTRTFRPGMDDDLAAWLGKHNGNRNIYFSVNRPLRDLKKKAEREDIAEVRWLHVDIDPRAGEDLEAERARALGLLTTNLPAGVPAPTVIMFSGGGYQGFWRLEVPIPINGDLAQAENAKRYNQRLETLFGADQCHNIDRIMRLPGTINVPDERKAKKGRVPTLAHVVPFGDWPAYPLTRFEPAPAVQAAGQSSTGGSAPPPSIGARVASLDELDQWQVPDRVKVIINQGRHPDEKKDGDDSRSAWLFDAVCQLVRCDVPEDVVMALVTDPAFAISESVLDKGRKAEAYAARQIAQARKTIAAEAADFQLNEKKVPYANQHNIRVALARLDVTVRHDLFQDRLLIEGLPDAGPSLSDAAMKRLWLEVETRFHFRPTKEYFWDVVEDTARRNSFHPVCDYLDALQWDGEPRLDTWLTTYGHADDTPYTRAVGALTLLAAVRRVRQPGCKFDEMPVLESEQGKNKSSALAVLAVREDWFTDDLPLNQDTQRIIERMAGRWIVEAAELKGRRKGDVEHLKAFLSRRVDRARLAYGRLPVEVPRQSVIIGTTNSDRYLRDGTGNRRFWPVKVGQFDLDGLRRDRDQLWAEAAAREGEGVSIRLDPSLWGAAAEEQDARRVEDPYVVSFRAALGEMTGKLKNEDAWTILGIPDGQRTQDHNARLGDAMRELGWERTKLRFGGRNPDYAYVRGTPEERAIRVIVTRAPNGDVTCDYEGAHQMEVPF